MARGLSLVLQHQRASADRRADYIKHRQQIQHRQSMMDRDARNRQVEQERRNQWQAQHNYQRFQQQSQLYKENDERDQMQQQQKQHYEDQKRREQYEKREQFAKQEIDRIRAHPGLSEEQKRSQIFRIERDILYDQADSGPPKDVPHFVGTEKDIGMAWWEDTDEVKPDTLGGGKWRTRYTRTNRHDVQVLFHEKKEYYANLATEREMAKKEATEEKADQAERRGEWKYLDDDGLESLLVDPTVSDADRNFISSVLRERKKLATKAAKDEERADAAEARRVSTDEAKKTKATTDAADSELAKESAKSYQGFIDQVHNEYNPKWDELVEFMKGTDNVSAIDEKAAELGLPEGIYKWEKFNEWQKLKAEQLYREHRMKPENEHLRANPELKLAAYGGGMSGMGGTGGMNLVPNETGLYELA